MHYLCGKRAQCCPRRVASTRRAGPCSTAAPGTFATTPASAGGGACGTTSQTTWRRYTNDGFLSEKRNNVSYSCKLRNKQAHELELGTAIKGHRARQIYLIKVPTRFFPQKTQFVFPLLFLSGLSTSSASWTSGRGWPRTPASCSRNNNICKKYIREKNEEKQHCSRPTSQERKRQWRGKPLPKKRLIRHANNFFFFLLFHAHNTSSCCGQHRNNQQQFPF